MGGMKRTELPYSPLDVIRSSPAHTILASLIDATGLQNEFMNASEIFAPTDDALRPIADALAQDLELKEEEKAEIVRLLLHRHRIKNPVEFSGLYCTEDGGAQAFVDTEGSDVPKRVHGIKVDATVPTQLGRVHVLSQPIIPEEPTYCSM